MTTLSQPAPASSALGRFVGKFSVLRNAIPELWISFALKWIGIASYGVMNSTLVLWMHSELGFRDDLALKIVVYWSLLMTIMTLLVGPLSDVLGIRKTLLIGTIICIIGRSALVWTHTTWVALVVGLAPTAIGEALGGPVMVAAARCYSNTRQRSMSFSIIYAMMNLGFYTSGWLFDKFRHVLGEHGHLNFPGLHLSTYQSLFFVSLIMQFISIPLILCMREGVEATDEGLKKIPLTAKPARQNHLQTIGLTMRQAVRETIKLFATLFRQSGFHRLLVFLVLISFIKLIYRQIDYVFPTFGVRELGDGSPIGFLTELNSVLIIFLAPLAGALTQRFAAYSMVVLGGLVTSASIFIMALPPKMFQSLADGGVGHFIGRCLDLSGPLNPYYVMIVLFGIVLSLGEALYSPRVYEYAAAIAPKGQESSYSALSYVPMLLAKMLVGWFSGAWLMQYCPETGPRHSGMLWLMVGLLSLGAPIGLFVLRPLIQVKEAGREEAAPSATS